MCSVPLCYYIDCSRPCSGGGTRSPDCAVCLCDRDVVKGRVRRAASPGTPLGGVEIRVKGRELQVEANTNSLGKIPVIVK